MAHALNRREMLKACAAGTILPQAIRAAATAPGTAQPASIQNQFLRMASDAKSGGLYHVKPEQSDRADWEVDFRKLWG